MAQLDLPQSENTVEVFLIDSQARLDFPAQQFMQPYIKGYDRMKVPSYSFLITHPSGQRVLFDLSIRSDFHNLAPEFAERCTNTKDSGWKIHAPYSVSEVLVKNGVPLEEINAIIWSHFHFDHTGDPALFPSSTDLVVGPGFIRNFAPGWPARADAPVRSSDWEGRKLREVNFNDGGDKQLMIGQFPAIDWFGDGSFYLLHTPGHTPDHLVGFARVQADSFVLMGADKDAGWFFPHRTLNGWRQAGLAERGMWRFLSDFKNAIKEE
ncbi:hypothetical protein ASPNIDRAFT_36440 [Aspergillus niger ATCC 1015]|uniref:Metallo-beta-lactamase domain-containing protein n=1 Tax=Aspergillus niger (strain ATCC 1015 / CBS 113.46 / FGSC A1144 / LSHB Ac4 / NCTC 3858a / NRRL 328 / USDA 3528.7) TaxID=380704 RepID=G3XQI8_ASPNA|nr:hypothetical protein ASPNIDRAFT_36440 [Aspergillus niger ATCC 1015]